MKTEELQNLNFPSSFQAHIAFVGFEQELHKEISSVGGKIFAQKDRLIISSTLTQKMIWSQCTWSNPQWIPIQSVNDAVKKLKMISKFWAGYHFHLHRRAELIQNQLLRTPPKPLHFLGALPPTLFGAWTLWDAQLILASAQTNSVFPLGQIQFVETKTPPSRAYLKLWELFSVYGFAPKSKERVLDLGSSPGGWTWVLSELGCEVISVDKALLAPNVATKKNVTHLKKDAFLLKPQEVGEIDILFSDIICEPQRLYDLIQMWRDSQLCKKFICTIKFKGKTDFSIIEKFKQIPKSQIYHLYVNKHELTWVHGFGDSNIAKP